ncbi:hypothetical protein [Cytophaga aurantiaca]|uniref:hypothetical protein n=1 Tax=Cytophaga aurantiaca TaxID=29530 RepID=UPI00037E7FAA|nr:hypothetical protein [Cytophaga aurantiaca]
MNLLKLNRWKLFLLISPFLLFFVIIPLLLESIYLEFLIEPCVILYSVFFFGWHYQIGAYLQKDTSKIKFFKLFFLIHGTLFVSSFIVQFYREYILHEDPLTLWIPNEITPFSVVAFIMLMLLSTFSIIYLFSFNVKTLLSLKNPAWPYNGVQTTLLLLYAPFFGVLFLQPRINKYIESKETN